MQIAQSFIWEFDPCSHVLGKCEFTYIKLAWTETRLHEHINTTKPSRSVHDKRRDVTFTHFLYFNFKDRNTSF